MKFIIGKPVNYIGPYQIAELLKYIWISEDTRYKVGTFLHNTKLNAFCEWLDTKRKRKVKAKIEPYDVWNADSTMAYVIYHILVKFQEENKCSYAVVKDEDIPEFIEVFNRDFFLSNEEFERAKWGYVIDECIWTFEQLLPETDWEAKYHSGNINFSIMSSDDDKNVLVKGPNDTHIFDDEGYLKHSKKIQNGLILFAKHFQNFWD